MATAAINPGELATSHPRWRDQALAMGGAFAVLAASLGNFLTYHTYPLLRPEVAIVIAGLAAVAAIYGAIYGWSGNLGRALLEGLLAFFAVDLNSDVALAPAFAFLLVASLRLRTGMSLIPILSTMAGAVLLTGMVGLSERRPPIVRTVTPGAPVASSAPAVLHLILDEHGGIAGITDPAMKTELAHFYTDRGFRLFARAYSRHFHTVNAIPDILNFGRKGSSRDVHQTLDIGHTAYLDGLSASHRLNIYQSDFADYCRYAKTASCTRYWSASLALIAPLDLPATEKARLMAYKFATLSNSLAFAVTLFDVVAAPKLGLDPVNIKQMALSSSLGGFAILDRIAADVRQARPGEAYFAHVLAPHYPYAMSRDCEVLPPSQWDYRRSPNPVAVRKAAYREQLRCLESRIDRIVGAFLASPAGRDGVIVIHGDHGARNAAHEASNRNRDKLTPADLMAGYSTLFAVRAPAIEAGIEERPFAVPALLRQLSTEGYSSASLARLRPGDGRVFLDGRNWSVGAPASIADAWPETRLTEHQAMPASVALQQGGSQ